MVIGPTVEIGAISIKQHVQCTHHLNPNTNQMKKALSLVCALTLLLSFTATAQEEEAKSTLEISGSADIYYKYDFSGYVNTDGTSNIGTSFADNQNSLSIGMLDVALSKSIGKVSFTGEFSFGPRSFKSIPTFQQTDGDDININIQNLYISYALSDKISLTAGYMGTFVGYEVISPTGNFNYSTSYLFSFGPFQNAGLKMDFAPSDNFGIMVGIFNDWNVYQDFNGVSDIGAQVYWAPVSGWDIYLNFLSGSPSGTILDLTTGYQITDKFYLGLNAADYSAKNDAGGYSGAALYPQYAFGDLFALGLRGEFFNIKEVTEGGVVTQPSESVFSSTLTGNFYVGPMTLSTEFRLDNTSSDVFVNKDLAATGSASQVLVAAIFAF